MFPPRLFLVYIVYLILALGLAKLLVRTKVFPEPPKSWASWMMAGLAASQALFYYFTYMAMHHNFLVGAADLATISQSVWNIANHRIPFETIIGTHALRVHFTLLWYPVALLFKLCPTVDALVLMSTLCVAACGYVIYALARDLLESVWLGLALGVSYLLNPYTQFSQLAAVHADSFDVIFICLSLYALVRQHKLGFFLAMAGALLGKEDVGLYYTGLGVYMALGMKRPGWGTSTLLVGLAWSLLAYLVFMPGFGPDTLHLVDKYFSAFGRNLPDIAHNLLLRPWEIVLAWLHWDKVFAWFYLGAEIGLSPLLSGWALVPLAVAMGFRSTTQYPAMYNFWDHYALHTLPFLYFSAAWGVRSWLTSRHTETLRAKLKLPADGLKYFTALVLLLLALGINLERGNTPLSRKFKLNTYRITEHNRLGAELLRRIPDEASVLAQLLLAPHLAFRREIYAVGPGAQHGMVKQQFTGAAEYAVFDLQQAKTLTYKDQIQATVEFLRSDLEYAVWLEQDGWVIFRRLKTSPTGIQ